MDTVWTIDSHLWAFVLVATLLAVTPGADTLLVVRNTLTRGRRAALSTTAGIAAGCSCTPRSPRSASR